MLKARQNFYKNSKICTKYNEGQISEPINTNKGARHGCGLAPDLFHIYINKATGEQKQTSRNGIQLTYGKRIQTILHEDGQ
jgi:hypothetical protein